MKLVQAVQDDLLKIPIYEWSQKSIDGTFNFRISHPERDYEIIFIFNTWGPSYAWVDDFENFFGVQDKIDLSAFLMKQMQLHRDRLRRASDLEMLTRCAALFPNYDISLHESVPPKSAYDLKSTSEIKRLQREQSDQKQRMHDLIELDKQRIDPKYVAWIRLDK